VIAQLRALCEAVAELQTHQKILDAHARQQQSEIARDMREFMTLINRQATVIEAYADTIAELTRGLQVARDLLGKVEQIHRVVVGVRAGQEVLVQDGMVLGEQLTRLSDVVGRYQGTQASTTGELALTARRMSRLEQTQGRLSTLLDDVVAALRQSRDELAALRAQHRSYPAAAGAFKLLERLMASPVDIPPVFRHVTKLLDLVCFDPKAVNEWLVQQGVQRQDIERVRAVWDRSGLVPSGGAGTAEHAAPRRSGGHDRRLRLGADTPYYMTIVANTYRDLLVPIPPDLPTLPPPRRKEGGGRQRGKAQDGSAETNAARGSAV